MSKILFPYWLLVFILLGESSLCHGQFSSIRISVEKKQGVKVESENGNLTVSVPDIVRSVEITCEGNCPVQWYRNTFLFSEFPDELAGNLKFSQERKFSDFRNRSTYTFISRLKLSGRSNKLTGEYSCTCPENEEEGRNVFFYWEGSSGSFLLQAGETMDISVPSGSEEFFLPCGTSKPNVSIFLLRGNERIETKNPATVRRTRDGFFLSKSFLSLQNQDQQQEEINDSLEFYCSLTQSSPNTNTRSLAVAKFKVRQIDSAPIKSELTLHHFYNLTEESFGFVNYDYVNNILICCSKPGTHRQVGYYCTSHQQCAFQKHRLQWGHNAQDGNGTCTWYEEGFFLKDGAVTFRCENDVLKANAEKFYGFNSKSYHSLQEAEAEKEFVISAWLNSTDLPYKNTWLKLLCRHSTYIFSEGVVWIASLQNGTDIILSEKSSSSDSLLYEIQEQTTVSTGMEMLVLKLNLTREVKVSCLLPIYNSWEWWHSSVGINIQDSLAPVFTTGREESLSILNGGTATLKCVVKGNPQPEIMWRKDNEILQPLLPLEIEVNELEGFSSSVLKTFTVTSILTFRVDTSSTGKYFCEAGNLIASERKLFTVSIKDTTLTTTLTVTAAVVTLLILILIFALWKIRQQRKAIRFLTQQEIDEFEKGAPEALARIKSSENEYSANEAHHLLPYSPEYEVPKEQLIIDHTDILGLGTYGMVLRGTLAIPGIEKVTVAVKTVKPQEDVSHFKMLLCETKIMAYIGSHQNIVCLAGAYTRNIRNREIYLATEFCCNGNLHSMVRKLRTNFTDIFTLDSSSYQNAPSFNAFPPSKRVFSTLNLLQWCADIATGMEFLVTKKVIHGDLAARNVLLDSNFTAKVGDFGLSKFLFQYTTYQKKTVQLLPWNWMALESLESLVFSHQSDVWAFGITVWEIFTLGLVPYPGQRWNDELLEKLKGQYRLQKPEMASEEIYQVMLNCWIADPKQRPTFTILKTRFQDILTQLRI